MAAVLNVAYATLVDENVRGLYAQDVCTRLASCGALLSQAACHHSYQRVWCLRHLSACVR